MVGAVGAALGDAGVNIAGAQVSRTRRGGEALMAVTVDSAVPAEVLAAIGTAIGATDVRGADRRHRLSGRTGSEPARAPAPSIRP